MKLKFIHRWTGLALSIVLLVISLSGTLLIWKKQYLWLTIPQARDVVQSDTAALAQAIEAIENSYSAGLVSFIALHAEDLSLHKVFLSDKSYAWHDQQGAKIQQWRANERIEDWLLDLHHRFLLGNIGLNIAGYSGILLMPLMLLGLVIWWPNRRTLKLGLLPGKRELKKLQRGPLIRSHSNLGFVIFFPLLLVAFSGVVLVYPSESRSVLIERFIVEKANGGVASPLDDVHGGDAAGWMRLIERTLQQYPNARPRWVAWPSQYSPHKTVGVQQEGGWNAGGKTAIQFDAEQGNMLVNSNALEKSLVERLFSFSYPLHTGKIALWYRLLLTVTGLGCFAISLFGVVAYLKR